MLAAFAALRLGPLTVTAGAGCLITVWVTFFTGLGLSGRPGLATAAAAVAACAGLAALALAFEPGRAQLAARAAVGAVLLAALVVPFLIAQPGIPLVSPAPSVGLANQWVYM